MWLKWYKKGENMLSSQSFTSNCYWLGDRVTECCSLVPLMIPWERDGHGVEFIIENIASVTIILVDYR